MNAPNPTHRELANRLSDVLEANREHDDTSSPAPIDIERAVKTAADDLRELLQGGPLPATCDAITEGIVTALDGLPINPEGRRAAELLTALQLITGTRSTIPAPAPRG